MKQTIIIMATLLSAISPLFAGGIEYNTAEIYDSLRKQVLAIKPEQLGEFGNRPILCILMETGYPEAVATLVAVADGSVSLYFSNGGGIIGAGQHPEARDTAMSFIEYSQGFLGNTKHTDTFPLPKKGNTRFYFVTSKGVKTVEAQEEIFGNNGHKLSPLFHKAHELIYVIQSIEEQKNAE